MKTTIFLHGPEKFQLSWGRQFFIFAGFIGVYYIAYLWFLLHLILKQGPHPF